jgi:hypothetical protein
MKLLKFLRKCNAIDSFDHPSPSLKKGGEFFVFIRELSSKKYTLF